MRLICLGSGGYHPNERRHTACLMLPELGIVLDAGTGFFRVQGRLQTREVNVFLSHAHLDHIVGLTFFIVPMLKKEVERVTVHGLPEHLAAVRDHLFATALFPVLPAFEFRPLPDNRLLLLPNGGILRTFPLAHPGGSVGYRLDWPDRSLAYITDTTASPNVGYIEFIRGVDLLIHECYFGDDLAEWAAPTGHSHLTPVLQVARNAGVRRLRLMHIDPQNPSDDPLKLEAARSHFPELSDVAILEDGDEIDF